MYGKLFAQMYDGSLYGKWQALVTFQQLIVLSDPDGVVDMTPQALAARTSIPLEIIRQGLADLEEPDPDSRTPDEDGRRIVRLSDQRTWGWRIVNHAYYRRLRSAEERRDYQREYQQQRRAAAANPPSTPVNTSQQSSTPSTHTEARSRKQKQNHSPPIVPPPPEPGGSVVGVGVVEVGTHSGNGHALVRRGREAVLKRGRHALAEVLALSQRRATAEALREQMVAFAFAYWQARHNHQNALQDPKREGILRTRLRENQNDVSELLYAADGARKDRNLMGENERGRKYDGIETIYRDRAQVERLAALAGYRPGMIHGQLTAAQGGAN